MLLLAVAELGIGTAVGLAIGRVAVLAFRRVQLGTTGLYPVASMAVAALAFGAADALHGSGFISVYLTGLALGSAAIPAKRTIVDFHEGLAWISQIAMFLTLGLLVNPSGVRGHFRRGPADRRRADVRGATGVRDRGHRRGAADPARVSAGGLGGPPRGGADRPRHLPRDRRRGERRAVLQHRLLRRPRLDAHPGRHARPARAGAGRDHRRSRRSRARCTRWAPSGASAPRCSSSRWASRTRSSD